MSRLAKARGSAFESLVEQHWFAYNEQKVCKVEKVDPPTRICWKGRTAIPIQLENPFLDYIGTWTERGGRMLMIEAKTTLDPRLPFDVKTGGLKIEQCESMKRWQAAGAAVAILWQHRDEIRLVLPVHIEEAEWQQRRSIKWDEAYQLRRGRGFLIFDWMSKLREIYP